MQRLATRILTRIFLGFLSVATGAAAGSPYDLDGEIRPPARASVSLYGVTSPYSTSTASDQRGRFRFRRLPPGPYTLAVFVPRRGEWRQTIEVGPSTADAKGRVAVRIEIPESQIEAQDALKRKSLISVRELSIPERARHEYAQAQAKLALRDAEGAIAHLERAVEIAPQFVAAWNNLGTIAYQTQRYADAEKYFQKALEQNPGAFEPLVNLGGVLITLSRFPEALPYNQKAVSTRARDALANSQLGMNYFGLGDLDRGEKYLKIAKQLDPAHFSHPQLTLAEIYLRQNNRAAAIAELEDLLRRHPDWGKAQELRQTIERVQKEN